MTTASPHTRHTGSAGGGGVRATARVRATSGGGLTTLPLLHNDGPFHLRRLHPHGTRARVCVISAMSAPLGGDRLAFDVTVETGAELEITTAAAALALPGPGPTPDHATYDVRLTVDDDATLHWLPQPLISTHGSDLRQTYTVDLAPTARLVLREELVLGRAAEPPGQLASRLTVRRDGRPLLDQHTTFGASAPGWDGPAVLNCHRATGQILVVDPHGSAGLANAAHPGPRPLGQDPARGQVALLPLAGPAVLATAVAPTATQLRRLLDEADLLPWRGCAMSIAAGVHPPPATSPH
ncbi:urease accessory protein UreD [Streptomyces sp. 6N223]|uniref:urease accessory protein UreD n=1 Tax=Streptomyces sp. 6N223 TaxID=3457412 RepID=UPI003FCEF2B5